MRGLPFTVELEKDLSHRQQLLDVAVVRREPGEVTRRMPDGFDNLANHNLVTYKSFREPLDDWTLKELTGHYVNQRTGESPSRRVVGGNKVPNVRHLFTAPDRTISRCFAK